jgi:hypothetical protein
MSAHWYMPHGVRVVCFSSQRTRANGNVIQGIIAPSPYRTRFCSRRSFKSETCASKITRATHTQRKREATGTGSVLTEFQRVRCATRSWTTLSYPTYAKRAFNLFNTLAQLNLKQIKNCQCLAGNITSPCSGALTRTHRIKLNESPRAQPS